MKKDDFYKSIGRIVGPKMLNILLIEIDQQSARNEHMLLPIRKGLGSEAADQMSEMLDAVFAAGLLRGIERGFTQQRGESHEG